METSRTPDRGERRILGYTDGAAILQLQRGGKLERLSVDIGCGRVIVMPGRVAWYRDRSDESPAGFFSY